VICRWHLVHTMQQVRSQLLTLAYPGAIAFIPHAGPVHSGQWHVDSFTNGCAGKNENEEKRELVFREDGQGALSQPAGL
jgi:hypothetical protein